MLDDIIDGIDGLNPVHSYADSDNSWYAYIIRYDADAFGGITREKFVDALHAEGCVDFDIPNSTAPLDKLPLFHNPHRFFKSYPTDLVDQAYPNAEVFFNSIIKLVVPYTKNDMDYFVKYVEALIKVSQYYASEV